jgi:hypothetical protein
MTLLDLEGWGSLHGALITFDSMTGPTGSMEEVAAAREVLIAGRDG